MIRKVSESRKLTGFTIGVVGLSALGLLGVILAGVFHAQTNSLEKAMDLIGQILFAHQAAQGGSDIAKNWGAKKEQQG